MVDGLCCLGGSKDSRRLLSGAGGGAFPSAYMLFTRQLDLPSLDGVDSCYKDLHSHWMSCGHVSLARPDYRALLVSDKLIICRVLFRLCLLCPPSQLGLTKGHLDSLRVENHLNHRDDEVNVSQTKRLMT